MLQNPEGCAFANTSGTVTFSLEKIKTPYNNFTLKTGNKHNYLLPVCSWDFDRQLGKSTQHNSSNTLYFLCLLLQAFTAPLLKVNLTLVIIDMPISRRCQYQEETDSSAIWISSRTASFDFPVSFSNSSTKPGQEQSL